MAEVPAIDVLSRPIDLGDRSGNRARETCANDQGKQFDHGQHDGDGQENQLHAFCEISQRGEQPAVEQRRPGLHPNQGRALLASSRLPFHDRKRRTEGDLMVGSRAAIVYPVGDEADVRLWDGLAAPE